MNRLFSSFLCGYYHVYLLVVKYVFAICLKNSAIHHTALLLPTSQLIREATACWDRHAQAPRPWGVPGARAPSPPPSNSADHHLPPGAEEGERQVCREGDAPISKPAAVVKAIFQAI